MTLVVPAIIPQSFEDLVEKTGRVLGLTRLVQVDILDGVFAPAKSWPYTVWGNDEGKLWELLGVLPHTEEISYEADLMIQNPELYLEAFLRSPFETLIFHLESTLDYENIISTSKAAGKLVGLALKPSTSLEDLTSWLPQIDVVQCMGNDKIGFQGVELDGRVYEKIKSIRAQNPNLTISVDIGVNFDTAPKLAEAGASQLVSGSVVFESDNIKETLERFKTLTSS